MTEESLNEINQTLRKQGRAAIAAQAAAEETLAALRKLEEKLAGPPASKDTREPKLEDTVQSLLPFLDSLDRVVSEARRLESMQVGWIAKTFAATREAELRALSEGVSMLATQVESLVQTWGVKLDRVTGVALDTDRHRVVETRPARSGDELGTVVEVLRPGCTVNGKRLREADVVVIGGESNE